MSRFMRLILMYDLDMSTKELTKEYTKFHKWILKRGYVMMQYSIYIKVLNAPTKIGYEIKSIKSNVPKNGNIRLLTITDAQYYNIEMLRGTKKTNESINTEKRRVTIEFAEEF